MKFNISSSAKNKICMELNFDKIEFHVDYIYIYIYIYIMRKTMLA